MKKFVCTVCGYVAEGEAPEFCPQCKAPKSKFKELSTTERNYVTEHVVGIAKDAPEEIIQGLRENFNGECSEVGMYLAMSRVADREGYPEVAEAWKRYAFEEAEHAAKFAELLGEVLTDSTKHFLRGALYFNETPNADSIAPISKYVEEDVQRLIESLRWKN